MKGQKEGSPKKVTKTGVSIIDNFIAVFEFLFRLALLNIERFMIVILIIAFTILSCLYVRDAANADKRVEDARKEAISDCKERVLKLENEVKDKNDHILRLETNFEGYQKLMSDRADKILDKVLSLKSRSK
jgi:uncharacterized protein YlxW (UPF0749 family)